MKINYVKTKSDRWVIEIEDDNKQILFTSCKDYGRKADAKRAAQKLDRLF